jgi:hypothetical protein
MWKLFGINPAQQGGVDPLAEGDEPAVMDAMNTAYGRYKHFRILTPSGDTLYYDTEGKSLEFAQG